MPADEDATVRLRPTPAATAVSQAAAAPGPPLPSRRGRAWPILLAASLTGIAAGAAWWAWQARPVRPPVVAAAPTARPDPAPAATPAAPEPLPAGAPTPAPPLPAIPPAPAFTPPVMTEAAMAVHRAAVPTMLRLAGNPAVFLLDFPSLDAQGAALNRVAALVEKAGLPRDRVLTPMEMAAAIAAAGDTPATFYYGHNYRGSELARFFALARRDGLALSAGEEWVETQYRLARGLVPEGQEIALVSIAAAGERLDPSARASILRHELSHGLFATRPAYAAHIQQVWEHRFTAAERAAFRAFLAREGYDATIEAVMVDEAQAYLLHTPDPRFFTAAHLGMTEADLERLRALMRDGAPFLD